MFAETRVLLVTAKSYSSDVQTAALDQIIPDYTVKEYQPNYQLIGSDASIDGKFVAPNGRIVQIPFIPMSTEHETVLFDSLGSLMWKSNAP